MHVKLWLLDWVVLSHFYIRAESEDCIWFKRNFKLMNLPVTKLKIWVNAECAFWSMVIAWSWVLQALSLRHFGIRAWLCWNEECLFFWMKTEGLLNWNIILNEWWSSICACRQRRSDSNLTVKENQSTAEELSRYCVWLILIWVLLTRNEMRIDDYSKEETQQGRNCCWQLKFADKARRLEERIRF